MPKRRLIFTTLLLAAELVILKALPATSSRITWWGGDPNVALQRGVLNVGPLQWDMMAFSTAEALDPYRQFFAKACPGRVGKRAAVCVAEALAVAFPEDNPESEWVDTSYDPSAVLQSHLSGKPGHCVTRSGLAATTLLSMGMVARVVQMQAQSGLGHYAFEVLDDERWVLVDPTAGATYPSAYELLSAPSGSTGTPHRLPTGASETQFQRFYGGQLAGGTLLFPEPWLYTRVGSRQATWPYRGSFVATGAPVPWLAVKLFTQWLMLPLTVLLLGSLLLLAWLRGTRKKT